MTIVISISHSSLYPFQNGILPLTLQPFMSFLFCLRLLCVILPYMCLEAMFDKGFITCISQLSSQYCGGVFMVAALIFLYMLLGVT